MSQIGDVLVGGDVSVVDVVAKTAALFLTAAVVFRMVERRSLAGFAPFDVIAFAAAGTIIGRNAVAADSSWLNASAALITLLVVHALLARLRMWGPIRRLVDPPIRVLVKDGSVDSANVRRSGLTREDLDAVLRGHGHMDPSEVHLAIFEAKGEISVVPKQNSGTAH